MDKYNLITELEDPPPILFAFTDTFLHEYYNFSYEDIEYFLKLSLLIGCHVEIVAANIWQNHLSTKLFNNTYKLFDQYKNAPLIRLSTRHYNTPGVFSNYFSERMDEKSHFLAMPGLLTLLDFQLPQTYEIARRLDSLLSPSIRQGGNLTKIYKGMIDQYYKKYNIISNENMEDNLSRLTVANDLLLQPIKYTVIEQQLRNINILFYQANGIASSAQSIYPTNISRRYSDIKIYYKNFETPLSDIIFYLSEIKLFPAKLLLSKINLKIFQEAYRRGILQIISKYIWYRRNNRNIVPNKHFSEQVRKKVEIFLGMDIGADDNTITKLPIELYSHDSKKTIFLYKLNMSQFKFNRESCMNNNLEAKIPEIISELRAKLNIEELKLLAIELSFDYEDFRHNTKLELVSDICLACKRKKKLLALINAALSLNPAFNLFSFDYLDPDTPIDWMASNKAGEYITNDDREKIITGHYKFQSIGFLEKGFNIAKRVCMIINEGERFRATGFFINKETILTNKHVIPSSKTAGGTEVWLNHESDTERATPLISRKIDKYSYVASEKYDMAICSIKEKISDFFDDFPSITYGELVENDTIPIIQHPHGWPKQICIGHNSLKYINDTTIQYITDTMPGSSGSPVFDSNWGLIGLHTRGGNIVEPRTYNYFFRNEGIHRNAINTFLEHCNIKLI
jgi:V8-like Glu-specific endopeptidase